MVRTSTISLALLGLVAIALPGCTVAGRGGDGPIQEFTALRKHVDESVEIGGLVRGGPNGPIVQMADFSLLAYAGTPWEPEHQNERVTLTGRLMRNQMHMESNTVLPFVLTDVTWRTLQGTEIPDMPRTMYVRPVNAGAAYEDPGQR